MAKEEITEEQYEEALERLFKGLDAPTAPAEDASTASDLRDTVARDVEGVAPDERSQQADDGEKLRDPKSPKEKLLQDFENLRLAYLQEARALAEKYAGQVSPAAVNIITAKDCFEDLPNNPPRFLDMLMKIYRYDDESKGDQKPARTDIAESEKMIFPDKMVPELNNIIKKYCERAGQVVAEFLDTLEDSQKSEILGEAYQNALNYNEREAASQTRTNALRNRSFFSKLISREPGKRDLALHRVLPLPVDGQQLLFHLKQALSAKLEDEFGHDKWTIIRVCHIYTDQEFEGKPLQVVAKQLDATLSRWFDVDENQVARLRD